MKQQPYCPSCGKDTATVVLVDREDESLSAVYWHASDVAGTLNEVQCDLEEGQCRERLGGCGAWFYMPITKEQGV